MEMQERDWLIIRIHGLCYGKSHALALYIDFYEKEFHDNAPEKKGINNVADAYRFNRFVMVLKKVSYQTLVFELHLPDLCI